MQDRKNLSGIVRFVVRIYRAGFPLFRGMTGAAALNCRHVPSCSEYMVESVEQNGMKGVWAGIRRILSCHPFNKEVSHG